MTDKLGRAVNYEPESADPKKPLKPIPIAQHYPKFSVATSNCLKNQDPDRERALSTKLRREYKKERKGAIRELRKDARFLADVQRKEQEEKDRGYNERMKRAFSFLEGERAEQKQLDKEKAKEKRRAGRK